MKTRILITIIVILIVLIAGCSGGAPEPSSGYQEQYDLGMRYLEEGKYDEAILAFSAAIEIDTKQPMAYVGRGDAYIALTQPDKAATDYEQALILDESMADVYIKLADTYIELGDETKAIETLERGLDETGDESIRQRLDEMQSEESAEDEPWGTFTAERKAMLEKIEMAAEAFDHKTVFEIMTSDEFLEMYAHLGINQEAGWIAYKTDENQSLELSFWEDEDEKDYWWHKGSDEMLIDCQLWLSEGGPHIAIRQMSVVDEEANGPYEMIYYHPGLSKLWHYEGNAVDDLHHGTAVKTDVLTGDKWIFQFDRGRCTNYVLDEFYGLGIKSEVNGQFSPINPDDAMQASTVY